MNDLQLISSVLPIRQVQKWNRPPANVHSNMNLASTMEKLASCPVFPFTCTIKVGRLVTRLGKNYMYALLLISFESLCFSSV